MGVKVKKSLKKFARKRLSDVITQRRRLRPVIQEMKEKAKRKEVRRVESARAEELAHQAQLQQLVEADQEFMNYLKTEDPSLLSFGADVLDSEDNPEEDEKEEEQEGEHDPLGLTPGAQQQPWEVLKSRLEAIFCAVIGNDPKGRNDNPTGSISRNGLRTATVTFQEAVARVSRGGAEEGPNPSHQQGLIEEDEEEEESRDKRGSHAPKYSTNKVQLSVRDSDAQRTIDLYVIETCTRNLPMAFNLYLKRSPRGALPKKCSQYHTIASLIRSYVTNLAHLITHLTQDVLKMGADATAIPGGAVTLLEYLFHHTAMLGTEYMGAFPIPMKRIVKSTLHCLMVAANNNNNNNVCESESDVEKGKAIDPPKDSELLEDEEPSPLYSASGALLRACARALGPRVRELLFKGIFQRYVQSDMVRKWSPKTAPAAHNMELFLVDLYGYDLPLAYQTLFGYVKQLAICLRTALLQPEDETALRTLHSWKYLCAFRCCERIVAAYATPEGLAPLVYPVCQIGLGVLDVFASPRAYPLHFHILNILVHLGESASVTVPLTPYFLRILSAPSFTSGTKKSGPNDAPKGVSSSSSAPGGEYRIPFLLRTNKASLKSTVYLTAVLKELMYVMTRHTAAHAHRIGFPEHFTLLHASIRRIRKACPRVEWASLLQEYLRRVDATEEFLRTRRCGVTFGPCDEAAIEAWEATVAREWCGGHAGSALLTGGNAAAVRCPLISYCLQLHRRREEALHRLMVYATLSSVTQQDGSDDDDDDDATNYGTEDAPSPEAAAMTTRRESSPQAATGEQPRRRAKRRVTLEDIVEHEDALARGKQRRASQENEGEIRAKQQVGGEGGSAHDPVERKRRARE